MLLGILIGAPSRACSSSAPRYPITSAERAANVTPTNYDEPPGTFERYGARGGNVVADTRAIRDAFKVGGNIKGRPGRTYRMSDAAYLTTSDTTIDLRDCTIVMQTSTAPFLCIGRTSDSASFIKTDRIKITGGRIIGAVAPDQPAYGIAVVDPPAMPYVNGGGCDAIALSGLRMSGFTGGFIATGASNITIRGCRFGGMVYHRRRGAGGYGVLFQTCFGVLVEGNRFKAGRMDRHAIYISADPGRAYNNDNVCKDVVVSGNVIDWTGTHGLTGFEGAIEVRSAERIAISRNVIDGSFGGIEYDGCNGNGVDITIAGNVIRGIRAGVSERNGIAVFRSSGTFTTRNVVIVGNTIAYDDKNVNGVSIAHSQDVAVERNTIEVGYGIDSILFAYSTNVRVGGNTIRADRRASSHIAFAGTCSEITVDPGMHSGVVQSEYKFYGGPTDICFDSR